MPRRRPSSPPKLNAQWRCAPRTPAWEELWRRILSDVFCNQEDEASGVTKGLQAGPSVGTESGCCDAG
jgi:hypothetical protein